MYVDIFSLGFGSVMLPVPSGTFAIRNLQVLRRYRLDRIPAAALKLACGTLGEWNPLSNELPQMEIVWHNETPAAWTRLDKVYRTPDLQKAGTGRVIFQPTDVIVKRLFPGMVRALEPASVVGKPPAPPPPPSPAEALVRSYVPDLTPIEVSPKPMTLDDIGISPAPSPAPVSEVVPPAAVDLREFLDDVPQRNDGDRCKGTTGGGGQCLRKATTPEGYCRTHQPRTV